jgi:hypothetical protein
MKEEAKNRLLIALPYMRKAVEDAKKKGSVQIGILSIKPDGSGNIEMRFDADDFFNDIGIIIDCPEQTKKDDIRADAVKFLNKHGIK